MKKTREELLNAINEIVGEDNTDERVIALIEDITDSMQDEGAEGDPENTGAAVEELQAEVESLRAELEKQKKRYKDRFFGRVDDEEDVEDVKIEEGRPGPDEIKIDDLFKEKE